MRSRRPPQFPLLPTPQIGKGHPQAAAPRFLHHLDDLDKEKYRLHRLDLESPHSTQSFIGGIVAAALPPASGFFH
jgi:hypothetical protein